MSTSPARIGIDLGGTKTEGIILRADGTELGRIRKPTPRDYAGTIECIASIVQSLEQSAGESATVGVGIPGAVSADTGLVKNANSTWLIAHPLASDLAARLRRPVRVMNDANCFTLSEATDGAASGAHVVFGVILGTGVGGGIAINREVVGGANLIAGEWGHNPLPWPNMDELPGPPCYCGKRGCIETFLSGPGLEASFHAHSGTSASTHEIIAAMAHDERARSVMDRYVDRLARGLATVINILDPDVVVLGGGMSNIPALAERVERVLPAYVFSDSVRTRVVRNAHGDSSGVRGAAWLWPAS